LSRRRVSSTTPARPPDLVGRHAHPLEPLVARQERAARLLLRLHVTVRARGEPDRLGALAQVRSRRELLLVLRRPVHLRRDVVEVAELDDLSTVDHAADVTAEAGGRELVERVNGTAGP